MSMTHGNQGRGSEEQTPPRPPSSAHSSGSSGSGSKHVKCIGRYVLTGSTLGKGNFARVEAAVHTLTRSKVGRACSTSSVWVLFTLAGSCRLRECVR